MGKYKERSLCYYDNNIENSMFGKIYNSYAVLDPRGLAPEGYRIPDHLDWLQFEKVIEQSSTSYNWQKISMLSILVIEVVMDNFYLNEASGWWCKSLINTNEISTFAHFMNLQVIDYFGNHLNLERDFIFVV